jgi:hypothetical protein
LVVGLGLGTHGRKGKRKRGKGKGWKAGMGKVEVSAKWNFARNSPADGSSVPKLLRRALNRFLSPAATRKSTVARARGGYH